jgi:hypothetical protein
MDDQIIANIKSRVERCRRLAKDCTDEKVRGLMEMAAEGEADIARLMSEPDAQA